MNNVKINENRILFSRNGELVQISPCGNHAIRFQAFPDCSVIEENYTLMPGEGDVQIEEQEWHVSMLCGKLKVVLTGNGKVTFYYENKKIIEEKPEMTFQSGFRHYENKGSGLWSARVTFEPNEAEHFFGLGHSWDNEFDLKGSSIDIRNLNAKCTIPFVYSSLGYGFLWNLPSTGLAELSNNRTRFSSDCCRAIDYVVIGGTPKEVCSALADLTGHAPEMPEWATGFWQSRLRYETQEELLSVARKYKELQIPVSAMVVDYFHWTEQGDYQFDPNYWQDVKAMADELHEMNTRLIVSVWPTINEKSENYHYMSENNMLMRTSRGSDRVFNFYGWQAEIDVTNPATREFVWSKLKQNYIDNGVDALWFDEAEPEVHPEQFDNLIWYKGRADMVALLYPYYYSKMAYEGFKSIGRDDIITLTRCAYLGSQKYASLVWSGDIPSTFESLAHQVKAGLNMSMCGIPWWNTDIGGFYGADTESDYFRELIIRWFQFGVFSPVMRLHGSRIKHGERSNLIEPSGDPNELWSFGERNFEILKDLVLFRERLRPYISRQMKLASEKGYPVMRPMFFEYPEDEVCYTLDEQYMFGDDIIFAPIVKQGQTEKTVYLPDGEWVLLKDNRHYTKGTYVVTAEIDEFIAFVKAGADVLV
ncbi:MAG: TIM-barrel domain-containing protein [Lachnospiraceae bacterium]